MYVDLQRISVFNVNSHASMHEDVHAKKNCHVASANRIQGHVKIGPKGLKVTVITLVALCGYALIIVCTSIKCGLVVECWCYGMQTIGIASSKQGTSQGSYNDC